MDNMKIEEKILFIPDYIELCKVIESSILLNFKEGSVSIVDCPNFKDNEFFNLSFSYLGGSPYLLDIGDGNNLRKPELNNINYNLQEISQILYKNNNSCFLGAGAVSLNITNKNGELIPNLCLKTNKNSSIAVILDNNDKYPLNIKYKSYYTGGLANLLSCLGTQCKVIRVHCKTRIGEKDFIETIRTSLSDYYTSQNKIIGLGGIFLVKNGTIKSHVMPGFCNQIMTDEFMINNWLHYFNIDSPIVCQSTILSDNFNTDCRLEHTHFFSNNQSGGHYHNDITPDIIEYEGYFICCEKLYKIRN